MNNRKILAVIGVSIMAASTVLSVALFAPVPLNILLSIAGGIGFGLKLGSIIKEE